MFHLKNDRPRPIIEHETNFALPGNIKRPCNLITCCLKISATFKQKYFPIHLSPMGMGDKYFHHVKNNFPVLYSTVGAHKAACHTLSKAVLKSMKTWYRFC